MKNIIYIICFTLIFTISSLAQEKNPAGTNSTGQKKTKPTQEKVSPAEKEKFIDTDGDGIKDNGGKKKRYRGGVNSDRFVDKDGDGINDNRCQGMGWSNQGKMKMYGKRGR